ncbi:MAG: hypothetical protein EA380_09600 [Phycisphaeraceae bacterium]|nr:MAG: hypothetical protein EA380_09600 [Phycisphaeraceae bacterium]
MQVLITGAEQGADGKGVLALAIIMDLETGKTVYRMEFMLPEALRTPEHKVQFTGNAFIDGKWFVCTHNEVLIFDTWPPRTPVDRITIPGFNDLHHCMEWRGNLAISNTGLETVDVVSFSGELLERYDLLRDEPDARKIDSDVDYRLIADTKPHLRHGNHLFEHDGELWTGQLKTFDAVCTSDLSKRLSIEVGMPHDGVWLNGRLFFTTTNGHLVAFDPARGMSREVYNLLEMTEGLNQLGWCRGVCSIPGDTDRVIVMFSRLRRSKWKDFGYWIKYGHNIPTSNISMYNLAERKCEHRWAVGEGEGYQVFQVDVLPDEKCV